MRSFTLLGCLAVLVQESIAGYVLEDDYTPSNFFSMFSFFTAADPTHGFVDYVDQSTAQSSGLISTSYSSVTMGVDSTNITPNGRPSVRLTSNKAYNHGLIILDLEHMPQGCGTWPAFWMVGSDWPNNGEIDIIEGVNAATTNSMTLHTSDGCDISNNNFFTGFIETDQCYVNAAGQAANAGCGMSTPNTATYGAGFNAAQGGVYATEWTSEAISIYFFPRSDIPADIVSGSPDPSGWGMPVAMFQGSCNLDSHFDNLQIVFDTTFCGDWAGAVWGDSTCSSQASTCDAFVQNNPSAFASAYWTVNSLKVYQESANSAVSSIVIAGGSSALPAATVATSTLAGVATSLTPLLSSLAPIPVASFTKAASSATAAVPTTFAISTWKPHAHVHVVNATAISNATIASNASATTAILSQVIDISSVASVLFTPAPIAATAITVLPTTTTASPSDPIAVSLVAAATPTTATIAPQTYWHTSRPLPSAWFPSGEGENGFEGGIPAVKKAKRHAHWLAHRRAKQAGAAAAIY